MLSGFCFLFQSVATAVFSVLFGRCTSSAFGVVFSEVVDFGAAFFALTSLLAVFNFCAFFVEALAGASGTFSYR
jgi:hypothetical protein